jgi:methionine-rich copper-binding protein CopC
VKNQYFRRRGGLVVGTSAIGAACLALALLVGRAWAHAELLSADPAPGTTLSASPAAIRLTFDEPLVAGSGVVLYAGTFNPVAGLTSTLDGATLHTTLAAPLAPDTYTVQWTAITADGHAVDGSYQFAVASPPPRGPVWVLGITLAVAAVALAIVGGAWLRRRRR